MTTFYCDSSALVKWYISETGSPRVEAILEEPDANGQPLHQIAIAKIGIVEIAAAFTRRERMGHIPTQIRLELYKRLLTDKDHRFYLLELPDETYRLASDLTQRAVLRGYDAVHLAAAIKLNQHLVTFDLPSLIFLSADANLCATAVAEGLNTDNPNNYPSPLR